MRFLIAMTLVTMLFAGCAENSSPSEMENVDIPTTEGDPLPSSILRDGPGRMMFSGTEIGTSAMASESITITPLAPTYQRTFSYPGPATDFLGPAPVGLYLSSSELLEVGLNDLTLTVSIMQGSNTLATFQGINEIDAWAPVSEVGNGSVEFVVEATGLAWVGNLNFDDATIAVPKLAQFVTEYQGDGFCNTFFIFFCIVEQSYIANLPDAPIHLKESDNLVGVSIKGGSPHVQVVHGCFDGFSLAGAFATCYDTPLQWKGNESIGFETKNSETTVIFGVSLLSSLYLLEAQVQDAPVTAAAEQIYVANTTNAALDLTGDLVKGENVRTEAMEIDATKFHCNCKPSTSASWKIDANSGTLNLTSLDGITLHAHGGNVIGAEPTGETEDAILYGNGPGVVQVFGNVQVRVGGQSEPVTLEMDLLEVYGLV